MSNSGFEGKVAVLPCTGVGQVVGTIARQVAYRVCEDLRAEDTVLVCLLALVKGVQEDIDMIRTCPVVVIEGCSECCGMYALKLQKGSAEVVVSVPDVIKGRKLKIKRESRRQLTQPEKEAVDLVAKTVVAEIDKLKSRTKNE